MSATTRRTKYSETLLSFFILGILATICLAIFWVQNRFNPAVENFGAKIEAAAILPQNLSGDHFAISVPQGIRPMSPTERFDPETLSDKINGKAELYLSAGFVELISGRFQANNDANTWFEVFLYDMGTPANAFVVFSNQRRRGADKLHLTRNAYATANAVFFTAGPNYVEMISAVAGSEALAVMLNFAEHYLTQNLGKEDIQADATDPQQLFPAPALIPDSFTLIARDAFGFDRFDKVYTAQYAGTESETTLFVSKRTSPADADTLAAAYGDFLIQFGGNPIDRASPVERTGYLVIDILDAYEIVFSKGPYLAGVHMAADEDTALQLAFALDRHLDLMLDRRIQKE